jgi:hypothetical protein
MSWRERTELAALALALAACAAFATCAVVRALSLVAS